METPALRRLRVFLRICFGYLPLISLVLSIFTFRVFFWMLQHPNSAPGDSHPSTLVFVSSYLVRLIPLLMAITYGAAWWTLKQGRRSARNWSISASLLVILSTTLLL